MGIEIDVYDVVMMYCNFKKHIKYSSYKKKVFICLTKI